MTPFAFLFAYGTVGALHEALGFLDRLDGGIFNGGGFIVFFGLLGMTQSIYSVIPASMRRRMASVRNECWGQWILSLFWNAFLLGTTFMMWSQFAGVGAGAS
jgi:hypothetical protein